MAASLPRPAGARLEGSCGPGPRDWIRSAPPQPGVERIEAFFAGHAYDPHRHDSYAIGYTLRGAQAFDYRGASEVSIAGKLIVLHPDERHDGRAGIAEGFVYRMLYLEPRLVRDALAGMSDALPFVPQGVCDDPRLRDALLLALRDLDRPLEPLELDAAILAVAEALLALSAPRARPATKAAAAPAVERARSLLAAEADRRVTSEELEAASGLDRFELARQFRRQLGTSPYRYLTMRRLERARRAIRRGAALADAAAECGFADQAHLTRQFRATFGLPPGRWRAMLRPEDAAGGQARLIQRPDASSSQ